MTVLSSQSIQRVSQEVAEAAITGSKGFPVLKDGRVVIGMIDPLRQAYISKGASGGLGPCSYDVCIDQTIWLWPFWGRLASTVEAFNIPHNVMGLIKDKSTWARRFTLVQNTLVDPGFLGVLTLELTRFLPWPVRIRKGTPIAQIVFYWLDQPTDRPYKGKYQNQPAGPQPAQDYVEGRGAPVS